MARKGDGVLGYDGPERTSTDMALLASSDHMLQAPQMFPAYHGTSDAVTQTSYPQRSGLDQDFVKEYNTCKYREGYVHPTMTDPYNPMNPHVQFKKL